MSLAIKTLNLTEISAIDFPQSQNYRYVQNLMQQKPQQLWQMLSHPQCHYYVCGDAKMADNVFEMMAIAKSEGKLSHPEAVQFFDKMKQEKRFYSDVWGVTLNF